MLPAADLPAAADGSADGIPIGLNETYLAPVHLGFAGDPHLIVLGDAQCGKTNLLRLIARSIVDRYTPDEARLVIVDYRRTLLGVVEGEHLLDYSPSAQPAAAIAAALQKAMNERLPGPDVTTEQLRNRTWWRGPNIYVLVDDYDMVATSGGNPLSVLADLLPQARDIGLHLVVARRCGGSSRAMYSDPVLQRLRELDSPGLLMSGNREEGPLMGGVRPGAQPPGRGTLIRRADGTNLVQTAWLDPL
jgi:S-DNA-T family DNA segregation ATPase FtsK/SpoIIIE